MLNRSLRVRLLTNAAFAAGLGLAGPAFAQVINYPNGSTNTGPIVLTTDTTQLQVTNGSATQAGVISGPHGFTKIGQGNLILTAANTYSGDTRVSGGVLTIGGVQALGSGSLIVTTGSVRVTAPVLQNDIVWQGANSWITPTGPLTVSGSISGAGTLRFHDGETVGPKVVLTGNNTFTGALIHHGVLQIGDGGTSGSLVADLQPGSLGSVIFNRSDDFTYGGKLLGQNAVRLEKLGAGSLTLTGELSINNRSSFLVSEGTLRIGDGGYITVRGGSINVASGAHLIVDTDTTANNITGVTGSGSFTKIGTGRVTAQGVIDNTGGVTVSEGTLQIGAGMGSGVSGLLVDAVVATGAVIAFDGVNSFSNSTYAFGISGGGLIRNNNVNTHILTGTNTNTGGVDAAFGVLQVGDGGTTGSITGPAIINSRAALAFNRSDTVEYSGAVSGSGELRQIGSGTLVLTGEVGPIQRTRVLAGTLSVGGGGTSGSIAGNILNNAALVFNRSDATTYGGVISGTGTVAKQGAGTLTLTGTNDYSGATTVFAGRLNVAGSISGSAVTVANGGVLTGTGTVGSATVASGGVLSTAGATGVLNVAGGVNFAGGSTYAVNVSPASAGRVNATGAANLDGVVAAAYGSGSYIVKRYNILSAQGGVNGVFASLTNTNLPAGFQAALSYDANNAYIDLEILLPSFAGMNQTQTGVADAIADYFNRTGGIDPTYAALDADQLELVGGEPGVANATAGARAADGMLLAFSDQMAGGAGRRRAERSVGEGWELWGRLDGSSSVIRADETVGYSQTGFTHRQVLLGADRALTPNLAVGLAYASGTADFEDGRAGRGEGDFHSFGIYGRLDGRNLYIGLAASSGTMDSDMTRTVDTGVTDVLRSTVESDMLGARLEAGGWMRVGRLAVQPYFAAQSTRVDVPAYIETASGAGTFALSYAAEQLSAHRLELGSRFETRLNDTGIGSTTLSFLLAGVQEHADSSLSANFTALPGSTFDSHGAVADGASVLLEAGISARMGRGLYLDGSMRGQFGAQTSAGAQVTLRYAW